MRRDEFDHAIRAAGAILGVDEVIVIGSQAIHGSVSAALPPEATHSVEVNVAPLDDDSGWKADLIDGSLGEGSMFHELFGTYAQGVAVTTAILPEGWRRRLVRYESPGTSGVVAWCLEMHDLWLSKAIAGRAKDVANCRALLAAGIVDREVLSARLADVASTTAEQRARVSALIESPHDG